MKIVRCATIVTLVVLYCLMTFSSFVTGWSKGEALSRDVSTPSAQSEKALFVPPSGLVERLLSTTPYRDRQVGVRYQDLSFLYGNKHLLNSVRRLYSDALGVPSATHGMSTKILSSAPRPGECIQQSFRFLGAYSGGASLPKSHRWGVKWIAKNASAQQAFETVLMKLKEISDESPLLSNEAAWETLPEEVQALVVDLLIATLTTKHLIESAFIKGCFAEGSELGEERDVYELFRRCRSSFSMKGKVVFEPYAFLALDDIDMSYLAHASITFYSLMTKAIKRFQRASQEQEMPSPSFEPVFLATPLGELALYDASSQTISRGQMVVDLGGNDHYSDDSQGVCPGTPTHRKHSTAFIVDLGGDDTYQSTSQLGYACGVFGIGALFDMNGNDQYEIRQVGLGAGFFGAGLLVDFDGDDQYRCEQGEWSQGAAVAGVGALIDLKGDDRYECAVLSQGFGGVRGVGLLVDSSGDDFYNSSATAHVSPTYDNRPLSFTQGASWGRRAEGGDGHSLAGGIGGLIDGEGDDVYTTHTWGQGAGYWWGLGFLSDLAGDDRYRSTQYAQGAAAHYGVGCLLDSSGNDEYNDQAVARQVLGHARDISIGAFVDAAGDDTYWIPHTSMGCGNANAIGFAWDKEGSDQYMLLPNKAKEQEGEGIMALGYARPGGGSGKQARRKILVTLGLFLDTQGEDRYQQLGEKTQTLELNNAVYNQEERGYAWSVRSDS